MPRQKLDRVDTIEKKLDQLVSLHNNTRETVEILDNLTDEVNLYDLLGRIESLEDDNSLTVDELQNQVEILEGSLANLETRIAELENAKQQGNISITISK